MFTDLIIMQNKKGNNYCAIIKKWEINIDEQ